MADTDDVKVNIHESEALKRRNMKTLLMNVNDTILNVQKYVAIYI